MQAGVKTRMSGHAEMKVMLCKAIVSISNFLFIPQSAFRMKRCFGAYADTFCLMWGRMIACALKSRQKKKYLMDMGYVTLTIGRYSMLI